MNKLNAHLESLLQPNSPLSQTLRRWQKRAAWASLASTALTVLAIGVIALLLRSERVHNYILATLQQRASSSLGVRVTLQNYTLHPATLSVDLYGLVVDGAAPYQNPPLLQVQHAQAGIRVVSFLRREWYFDNIRIDRPIVQIIVDSIGVSNLPVFKSDPSSTGFSTDSIFDLGIRHVILDHGELYYNSRPSQLAADLHDLDFHASFNALLQQYSGALAYSGAHIAYGSIQPLQHDLVAEFNATRTAFNLTSAKITSGASQINLNATLNNYAAPIADAKYDITVDGDQAAHLLGIASIPTGQLRTTGSVRYQQIAGRDPLTSIAITGELASRALALKTPQARAAVNNLAAHYALANGVLNLHDLRAALLGGEVTAFGNVELTGSNPHSKLNAALHGVSLAEIKRALGRQAQSLNVGLAGSLNATATAAWGKSTNDLIAHTDLTINGHAAAQTGAIQSNSTAAQPPNVQTNTAQSIDQGAIPVESAIHATYRAASHQLELDSSYLKTPQTDLTMNGTIGKSSTLNLRLQANDLKEVESIADLFRPGTPDHPSQPLDLAGAATFQGVVRGSTSAPHLTGQLSATNLQVAGSNWKSIRTNIDASPSSVSLQHADFEPASRGHIAFDATTALDDWAFTNSSNIQLNLQASQLDVAEIARLTGQSLPVTGILTANLALHGTELEPAGNGSITLIAASAYGQSIQSAKLIFNGDGREVHTGLTAQIPAGTVDGKATIRPKEKTYTAQLSSSEVDLAKLEILKNRSIDAIGILKLSAKGQGSFDNPQLDATLQIPSLKIHNQTINDIDLQANLTNHIANASLSSKAVNTSIQAKAKVALTGDYIADATLDTQQIPLQPLLAAYAPDQADDITGETELHATLHGPIKNTKLLEAHVTIPVLKMAYGNTVALAAAAPIHVDYTNGIVHLQRAAIRGTDTDLQFEGSIPTTQGAPMSLLMLGTVNLQLAQLFNPDIRSSGGLKLNVNSTGENFGGEIQIVDASIASNNVPVGLSHANGVLSVARNRVSISKLEGTLGGGQVTASGGVTFSPRVQFDLGVTARGARLLYPQGMRESIGANIRLTGSTDSAVLGGTVNLTDLSFTPAFDLPTFVGQFSGGVEAPPSQGFAQNVQLNLTVHSTSDVNLVSRALSVGGSANLQVRGTAANPVILGRVNLSSGDIILNGSRFILNGGTVQFVNPSETEPVVNLSLGTSIQQYNITLRFEGPVNQLRTQYSSDPALPPADIINLLAFGQTTEASSANPSTPANQAAESLLASQVSSQVTGRVSRIAGISQLSISPVLANSSTQGPAGANITIQQRVTGNLFVTFSSNVASTQSQTIQGQYQISPRVAVSATRDPNGGFAVDTLIKKSW